MKKIINCFVDIIGAKSGTKMHGIVDVVSVKDDFNVILNLSETQQIKNITNNLNLPQSIKGVIQEEDDMGNKIPIEGVIVTFIKDFNVVNNSQTAYNGNQIIVDYCVTDVNGQYVVFVEPNIYTIRVDDGKNTKYFYNQEINGGLINQFYYTINGALVKTKYNDIIVLNGISEKLINGFLIDEHGLPLANAELILSQNEEVIVYIKTNNEGHYSFLLNKGIYDIRIRGYKQPIKMLKNFEFDDDIGFVLSLQNQSILFREMNWLTFL